MEIKIEDYLSKEEIKEIVESELREQIKNHFQNETNSQRLLSNLSYHIIFNEIDKTIPNSQELIVSKTKSILNNIQSYSVFRDSTYGSQKSLAYKIMEDAVKNNTDLIHQKVKETIINKDYSKEIWNRFEQLGENFMDMIYKIAEIGKNNDTTRKD